MTPAAIVTDIEGTTSSISFVHDSLFPYARARLAAFVRANVGSLAEQLAQIRKEADAPGLDLEGCIERLLAWHDADRKLTPLKAVQGMIWAEGYASGMLTSDVYPDAVAGLRRWHRAGIFLYIYSSGSVAAQKLLFGHTAHGDLTPLFSGYFDTTIGGKKEAASYAAIARAIERAPGEILFLSDVEAELAAAADAGFAVTLLARDEMPADSAFPAAASFDDILPVGVLA